MDGNIRGTCTFICKRWHLFKVIFIRKIHAFTKQNFDETSCQDLKWEKARLLGWFAQISLIKVSLLSPDFNVIKDLGPCTKAKLKGTVPDINRALFLQVEKLEITSTRNSSRIRYFMPKCPKEAISAKERLIECYVLSLVVREKTGSLFFWDSSH